MFEPYDQYIDVIFDHTQKTMVRGLYQYDHGLKLRIHGLPLDVVWQMQFGYRGNRECITSVGLVEDDAIVGDIPDVLLMQQREVICYVCYEDSTYGMTVYEIYMPLMPRLRPAMGSYTPQQTSIYEQMIAQMESLIGQLNTEIDTLEDPVFTVDPDDGCLYITQ